MLLASTLLAALIFAGTVPLTASSTATSTLEIASIRNGDLISHKHFDLTGKLLQVPTEDIETLIIEDDFGTASIYVDARYHIPLSLGNQIRVTGNIFRTKDASEGTLTVDCTNITFVAHGHPPVVPNVKGDELFDSVHDGRPVKIIGTILDAFQDEIDPHHIKVELLCDGRTVYATSRSAKTPYRIPYELIGSKVEILGVFSKVANGLHPYSGRSIYFAPNAIRVLSRSENPFLVPELDEILPLTHPSETTSLGRRRTCGRVLATWQGNTILIKTKLNRIVRVVMSEPRLPRIGECIEAVGPVETDIYFLSLTRAHWRSSKSWHDDTPSPTNISARTISYDSAGNLRFNPRFHGRAVRLHGSVINMPHDNTQRLTVESDGILVPVEAAIADNLATVSRNDTVEVSGICVLDTENWRPNAPLPRIRGFFIVLTDPSGLRIISHAPWWTLKRLLLITGILLAFLLGILIWNRALSRRSDLRGRELAEEQIAHATSEIKIMERTRLAVELHDSVAQTLAGIALELQTAKALISQDALATQIHLDLAEKSLRSCRSEIRNCLMDLRSDALDIDDMNEAIRRTLATAPEGVRIKIRFNVPRVRISDNTAHVLLRIIRELTINAIRHGHATEVLIAGAIENGSLLFSVRDNGCGFDPDARPGVREGHYGLQGVRERVTSFSGQLKIDSATGHGTKVSISIQLPRESNQT